MSSNEQAPAGDYQDNDYASRTGQSTIPVQRDEAPVEASPYDGETADSDQQLGMWKFPKASVGRNEIIC